MGVHGRIYVVPRSLVLMAISHCYPPESRWMWVDQGGRFLFDILPDELTHLAYDRCKINLFTVLLYLSLTTVTLVTLAH